MAKRTRGSNRPGQRPPKAPSSAPARPIANLSRDEEARAAEIESQIVARERTVESDRARARERAKAEPVRSGRAGGQGLLAVRAAAEYNYVVRDVRRILYVGGAIAAILAVVFILVDVVRVITIS
jgi:hypothetical protein